MLPEFHSGAGLKSKKIGHTHFKVFHWAISYLDKARLRTAMLSCKYSSCHVTLIYYTTPTHPYEVEGWVYCFQVVSDSDFVSTQCLVNELMECDEISHMHST